MPRPKADPSDPQIPINPARVRAALLFSGLTQREVVETAKRMKLATLTERSIQSMIAGNQRTSRRSRVLAVARATGFPLEFLTEVTGESLQQALARGIAVNSPWDTMPWTGGVRAVARAWEDIEDELTSLLDLDAWRQRTSHLPRPSKEQDREEFMWAAAKVLRMAFKSSESVRHEALKELRAWLLHSRDSRAREVDLK